MAKNVDKTSVKSRNAKLVITNPERFSEDIWQLDSGKYWSERTWKEAVGGLADDCQWIYNNVQIDDRYLCRLGDTINLLYAIDVTTETPIEINGEGVKKMEQCIAEIREYLVDPNVTWRGISDDCIADIMIKYGFMKKDGEK